MALDKEIKVRLPSAMKEDIENIAEHRMTSANAVVRQALIDYLERHRSDIASFRENSPAYKTRKKSR